MAGLSLLGQLFLSFFRIGLFGFGGGYAMLPLIQHEIITLHHWLTMPEFINIVAISQITPGPVAINAATYVGWRLEGFWGAAVATGGVVLPSLLIMVLLERIYRMTQGVAWVEYFFAGIRPVIFSLLVVAAYYVFKATPLNWQVGVISLLALVATWRGVNPTWVIAGSGVLGLILFR